MTPEAVVPVVTGTATVTLGADGAEAEAARKATGGDSPASSGKNGTKAGDLAVRVAPGNGKQEATHAMTVQGTDRDKGRAAGVAGPLVALTDAEAQAAGGPGRGA
ncbi:hypothetical protein VM98_37285, partial [Streptomyces rubellomurinus subsp. indigoferus]